MNKLLAAAFSGLLLVILFSPVNIVNAQGSVTLDHTCGLYWGDSIFAETKVTFYIRFNNTTSDNIMAFSNGFRIWSPDGAVWNTLQARCMSPICSTLFDAGVGINYFGVTGSDADTIGFWGVSLFSPGMSPGFSEVVLGITIGPIPPESDGLTVCLDSSFFPPSGSWMWGSNTRYYWPGWSGEHCFKVYHVPCCEDMDADGVPDVADNCPEIPNADQADFDGNCIGDACQTCCVIRGDMNHSGSIDISDAVFLVNYFFYLGIEPPCLDEADVNDSGAIDISDLAYLVDFMFNRGPAPVPCR